MKFVEKEPNNKQQFGQKKTLEVLGCTKIEFISFVKEKVDTNYLELNFLEDEETTIAFFPDESILYFHIDEQADESSGIDRTKVETKTEIFKPSKSGLFTNTLLIVILLLSSLFPNHATAAGYFNGSLKEDPTSYSAIGKARFNTPSGLVTIPGHLSMVQSKNYSNKAFSYLNPNRIKDQPTMTLGTLPAKANEDLLIAILAYREKFTLEEIKSSTGLQITQNQLEEATQLAVWSNASTIQLDYQIDTNSISDSSVRALSTEINTWANQQVNSKGSNTTMGDYLFPIYKSALDTSAASDTATDTYTEYGPYTVSGQKGSKFATGVLGGVLLDGSKNQIKTLEAGQTFFVRFPITYTGDKAVRLVGKQNQITLNYGFDRLWLDKSPKEHEVNFSVGSLTGDKGAIKVKAVDSFTGKPVEGVNVQVSTSTPVNNFKTDQSGSGEYLATTGKYNVSFTVPEGYLTPKSQDIEVKFAGDVQTINLSLEWSQGIINFHSVDSQSLKSTGNSEAFIYDSNGKAVKRIAFTNGRSSGIVLPEGDYTLVQYKTDGGYAVNTGTDFKSTPGIISDVSVTQDPNAFTTTIQVAGGSSSDTWIYTVSTGSKVLFKMNSNNILKLSLPVGSYSVMATKSDGTAFTSPHNFSTVLNGATDVVLEKEVGTETVTFTMIDTVKGQPIPNMVVGLFDEEHNLITHETASPQGKVTFSNVKKYSVYYVNILAAPPEVSGYSADGNRFLGYTRDFTLRIYSQAEIKEVTEVDTLYRLPNVVYSGPSYEYPK